jgi:hypothetical protein
VDMIIKFQFALTAENFLTAENRFLCLLILPSTEYPCLRAG